MASISQLLSAKALPTADLAKGYCDVDASPNHRAGLLSSLLLSINTHAGFVKLVKEIGTLITHHDERVRVLAMQLLADLLLRLPDLRFPAAGVDTMLNFFLSRFASDFASASPCLDAIRVLLDTQKDTIDLGDPEMEKANDSPTAVHVSALVSALCTTYDVAGLTQQLRFKIFGIILVMLECPVYLTHMRAQSNAQVILSSFIDAMDGEKDPRCLLQCLRITSLMLAAFPSDIVSELCDSAFQVTSVYFPITFRPPPNDPFGISTHDLVSALDSVFSATPYMAQDVVPMLLEKLRLTSSDAVHAKVDALRTLVACAPTYGAKYLAPFLQEIAQALLLLMFSADDASIEKATLDAISAVAKHIAMEAKVIRDAKMEVVDDADDGEEDTTMADADAKPNSSLPPKPPANKRDLGGAWNTFVVGLSKESETSVRNSVTSMVGRASTRVMAALAGSSAIALECIMDIVVPLLEYWCTYADATVIEQQSALDMLLLVLNEMDDVVDYPHSSHPVLRFVPNVWDVLMKQLGKDQKAPTSVITAYQTTADGDSTMEMGTKDESTADEDQTAAVAVECMQVLVVRPPSQLISNDQVIQLLKILGELVLDTSTPPLVHTAALEAISVIGLRRDTHAQIVCETILPLAMARLSDTSLSVKQSTEVFGVVKGLCRIGAVMDIAIPQLLALVCVCSNTSASTGKYELIGDSASIERVFHTIAQIVLQNRAYTAGIDRCCVTSSDQDAAAPALAPALFMILGDKNHTGEKYDSCSNHAASILRTLAQTASAVPQAALLQTAVDVLVDALSVSTIVDDSSNEQRLIPAACAVVASVRRGAVVPKLEALVYALLAVGMQSADNKTDQSSVHLSTCQCLASLFNKANTGAELNSLVAEVTQRIYAVVDNESSVEVGQRLGGIRALVWMTKALAMRSHSSAKELTMKLIGLLSSTDSQVSVAAAYGMGTVVAQDVDVLNKACYARESFLFRQKLFSTCFEQLKKGVEVMRERQSGEEDSGEKQNSFVLAIMLLVESLPLSVLVDRVDDILPQVLGALAENDVTVRTSALYTFRTILHNTPDKVVPHLSKIIPLLLDMTLAPAGLLLAGRVAAIECVKDLAQLKYHQVHPFRQIVVKRIRSALDDHKRDVRVCAAACRNTWLTLSVV